MGSMEHTHKIQRMEVVICHMRANKYSCHAFIAAETHLYREVLAWAKTTLHHHSTFIQVFKTQDVMLVCPLSHALRRLKGRHVFMMAENTKLA